MLHDGPPGNLTGNGRGPHLRPARDRLAPSARSRLPPQRPPGVTDCHHPGPERPPRAGGRARSPPTPEDLGAGPGAEVAGGAGRGSRTPWSPCCGREGIRRRPCRSVQVAAPANGGRENEITVQRGKPDPCLRQTSGPSTAFRFRGPPRRDLRAARPQRRRQVDHLQDDVRAAAADLGRRAGGRTSTSATRRAVARVPVSATCRRNSRSTAISACARTWNSSAVPTASADGAGKARPSPQMLETFGLGALRRLPGLAACHSASSNGWRWPAR